MGTVRDFVYGVDGGDANTVSVVLVEMDDYKGTPFFEDPALCKVIPFSRIDGEIIVSVPKGTVKPKRRQFPIRLANALTIHKAQGQGFECARLNIGPKEKCGSTYVAMSRLTEITGMWLRAFDMQRLLRIGRSPTSRKRISHDCALASSVMVSYFFSI